MRFELWREDEEDGPTYTLLPENSDERTRLLAVPPGAVLIEVIEAESYNEAAQRQHDLLGWEPYKPYRQKG